MLSVLEFVEKELETVADEAVQLIRAVELVEDAEDLQSVKSSGRL